MTYIEYVVAAYAVFAAVLAWDFIAPRLQTQVARVSISGLGRAKVWATEELNASLSGVPSASWARKKRGVPLRNWPLWL